MTRKKLIELLEKMNACPEGIDFLLEHSKSTETGEQIWSRFLKLARKYVASPKPGLEYIPIFLSDNAREDEKAAAYVAWFIQELIYANEFSDKNSSLYDGCDVSVLADAPAFFKRLSREGGKSILARAERYVKKNSYFQM